MNKGGTFTHSNILQKFPGGITLKVSSLGFDFINFQVRNINMMLLEP